MHDGNEVQTQRPTVLAQIEQHRTSLGDLDERLQRFAELTHNRLSRIEQVLGLPAIAAPEGPQPNFRPGAINLVASDERSAG